MRLFPVGLVLLAMEAAKQLYVTFAVNGGVYDPWIFPFQLCSMPMYLCLVYPLCGERGKETIRTFFVDYTAYGALFALIYPEGMFHVTPLLTVHGFAWHILILSVALYLACQQQAGKTWGAFLRATALLLVFCAVATLINVCLEGKGLTTSYPDMFYLTPYHLTMQPVAHDVELTAGRLVARLLYILGMICFGALSHLLYIVSSHRLSRRS